MTTTQSTTTMSHEELRQAAVFGSARESIAAKAELERRAEIKQARMHGPTPEERQAELEAILADKGLEAATQAARRHAAIDVEEYPQYGEGYFESWQLARGRSRMAAKSGQALEAGDLVLVKVEPHFPWTIGRATIWASRGIGGRAVAVDTTGRVDILSDEEGS